MSISFLRSSLCHHNIVNSWLDSFSWYNSLDNCSAPTPVMAPTTQPPVFKFMKPNKVVIVQSGRFAGRKAMIVKAYDDREFLYFGYF